MNPWFKVIRLRTLPLALACIALGALLAADFGVIDGVTTALCVLTALSYQILSNLANDLGDGIKGTDDMRADGAEARALASGAISEGALRNAVTVLTVTSLILTLATVYWGTRSMTMEWSIGYGLLGLLATLSARGYTMGASYGYRGFGDLFVLLFFGPVGVAGTFTLISQLWIPEVLLAGIAIGAMAAGVLNLNNLRDIESDAQAGKRTLAMRLGATYAKRYQWFLLLLGYGSAIGYVILQTNLTCSRSFLFLAVLPLSIGTMRDMHRAHDSAALDALLKPWAIQTILFALFMGIGLLIDSNDCSAPLM